MNNQKYTCVSLVLHVVSGVYIGSHESHLYFTLTSAILYLTLTPAGLLLLSFVSPRFFGREVFIYLFIYFFLEKAGFYAWQPTITNKSRCTSVFLKQNYFLLVSLGSLSQLYCHLLKLSPHSTVH